MHAQRDGRRNINPGPCPTPIPDRGRASRRILYREVTSSVPPLQLSIYIHLDPFGMHLLSICYPFASICIHLHVFARLQDQLFGSCLYPCCKADAIHLDPFGSICIHLASICIQLHSIGCKWMHFLTEHRGGRPRLESYSNCEYGWLPHRP